MKPRTITVASIFARSAGIAFGTCLFVIGMCELINGCLVCLASEREA